MEQLTELKGGIDGVPTGFVDLDNLLTGLHGGELVIVGARPSICLLYTSGSGGQPRADSQIDRTADSDDGRGIGRCGRSFQ